MTKEKVFVKPCWYIDALGMKCGNQGIAVDVLESILLDEIRKNNMNTVISFDAEEDKAEVSLQSSIAEKEALLQKHRKALDLVNDAYELGDYTRKEWLLRKEKWQKSIDLVKSEIFDLKKKFRSQHRMTDEERQKNLLAFLNDIKSVTENSQRNELYRTIINGIVYLRVRDNIQMKINFK